MPAQSIVAVKPRHRPCDALDTKGARTCPHFAAVRIDTHHLCRRHAVERLNQIHQADLEFVHQTIAGGAAMVTEQREPTEPKERGDHP